MMKTPAEGPCAVPGTWRGFVHAAWIDGNIGFWSQRMYGTSPSPVQIQYWNFNLQHIYLEIESFKRVNYS